MRESAREYRRRAEAFVAQGRYAEAADAYRREAAIYRSHGDTEGAKAEEAKADRYTSSVRLFAQAPGTRPWVPSQLAKWEPAYGCYLGAFIDRDERLGRGFLSNDQLHRDPDPFGRLTGKKLASTFCYLSYGRAFPAGWVARLKAQDVAPHIAWEPNRGLDMVQDDSYLRRFAEAAGRADVPIFLRFASEMNGGWTRYGGDPLRYKTKWAIVRNVLARYAPNVAMVWCVANIPERPIPLFYPGDAYVDWVGVNLYSVPFFDNNPRRPGLHQNPADLVRYVYRQFAERKPIAICEYGASHRSAVDGLDRSAWAAKKIGEMYASLPRLYPRVKLIDIFDNDNISNAANAARRLNNYSVTDTEMVRAAYARAVAPDYFLSTVGESASTPVVGLEGVKGTNVPRGILRVSSWARCYADEFSVTYALDGRDVATVREHGPRDAAIPVPTPGARRLTAIVRDDKGRIAARTEAKLLVS
jgi:hypothetical protein